MTRILTILSLLFFATFASAQLLITEINYNSPDSGQDSLEYISIYNSGDPVDVTGYRMEGVTFEFPSMVIGTNEYFHMAIEAEAFLNTFGIVAMEYGGALSNGGEDLSIRDADDNIIHEVIFDDAAPWPTEEDGTDGNGASIVLCDFENSGDGASWKASKESTGKFFNGIEIFGNPGSIEDAACDVVSGIVVTAMGLEFIPKDITIDVGETVTFVNAGGNHNVNGGQDVYPSNPVGFTNGAPSTDLWTFEYTFDVAGFYEYQCDLHVGAGMVGTVTVLPAEDNTELRVTEVFYNSGIELDSIEFIEIYNAGDDAVNLEGYTLTAGSINSVLGSMQLNAGEYMVLAKDESAFNITFPGVEKVLEWGEGTLNNQGDNIVLSNAGIEIFNVTYDDDAPWPSESDGFGASLILCDLSEDFQVENIRANAYPEVIFDGKSYFVSPGVKNYCSYAIGEVTQVDAAGENTESGASALLEGLVYGINVRPGGLQFTVIDEFGDGIGTFSGTEDFGYVVNEGDAVRLLGSIGQFNGLSQIYLDSVILTGSGTIVDPTIVTSLNEDTESQLIRLENVMLVNPTQWLANGNSFNFDVTDGTNVYSVRIDNDVEGIEGFGYPTGTFTLTGIGGQYDENSPYDEGYQIFPRYKTDIDPFVGFVNTYPDRTIGEMTTNDANGVADSLNQQCALVGVVYGINLRASGLQFTLIDDAGDGIAVFSSSENFSYTVNEGDLLQIKGTIDQFSGLTEIIPDSLFNLGTGTVMEPTVVTQLNESTESQYVKIDGALILTDPNDWKGDGTTFTVTATDGTNNYTVVIDNDSDLSTSLYQDLPFELTGIGSQRDVSEPYDEDYRIVPNFISDVNYIVSNKETFLDVAVKLTPNPATNVVKVEYEKEVKEVYVFDITGKLIYTGTSSIFDISELPSGTYSVRALVTDGIVTKKLVKN